MRTLCLPDDELVYLYENTGETTCTLADRFGCSSSTILRRLKSAGVDVNHAKKRRLELPINDIVSLYEESGETIYAIADRFDCDPKTIYNRLVQAEINIDPISRNMGENNSRWLGGISFEPYCPKFNDNFKKRVREFFGNRCMMCGKSEGENGRVMDVHHVSYNKDMCCDDSPPMFVPLCLRCHPRTNFDRDRWEYMFRYIIQELYDGKSFIPK